MKQQIENIIKENLPEKVTNKLAKQYSESYQFELGFDQALSQINTSLIADEVLKVVVEDYRQAFIKTFLGAGELWFNYFWDDEEDKKISIEEINNLFEQLLSNLSPNKENKNNE